MAPSPGGRELSSEGTSRHICARHIRRCRLLPSLWRSKLDQRPRGESNPDGCSRTLSISNRGPHQLDDAAMLRESVGILHDTPSARMPLISMGGGAPPCLSGRPSLGWLPAVSRHERDEYDREGPVSTCPSSSVPSVRRRFLGNQPLDGNWNDKPPISIGGR